MTIELILLLIVTMFILLSFGGKTGPGEMFKASGPRLGARVERHIATGSGFKVKSQSGGIAPNRWVRPPGAAPTEKF